MKYVVASALNGRVYYMDNKLYDHKKQAFNRLKKLSETKPSGLWVYEIKSFDMALVEE
jgi:hypothetical protein